MRNDPQKPLDKQKRVIPIQNLLLFLLSEPLPCHMETTKELKVQEFNKKQELLDFANKNSQKLNILTITTSQEGLYYRHFLWYYDNQ